MTARVIEGKWGQIQKPELTSERKAALYSRTVASVRFLAGQLEISRDANRLIDKGKAQYFDCQIHELFKILWRAQQEVPCICWVCCKERESCGQTGVILVLVIALLLAGKGIVEALTT